MLAGGLTGCDSGYSNNDITYEEARLTLEQQETLYPTTFLTVDGTYRKNLIGEWVMVGTVGSSATIATYKDVVLTISYYSKTQTLLGTETQTIYDYFTPGNQVKFKLKSFGYKGAKSIGLAVSNAVAAY